MPDELCPVCRLPYPTFGGRRRPHRHRHRAVWTDARQGADAAALILDPTGQSAAGRHR